MNNTSTLAANMRNAFIERKGATIGGGKFTPEELKDGAFALKAVPDLLAALEALTGMAEAFPSELHAKHPDVVAARELIARCTA